jgi:hypothetical protein
VPAAGSLADFLRAQIGQAELAKELLLSAGSLRGFLVHGLETTLVLPIENLHLGRTLGTHAAFKWLVFDPAHFVMETGFLRGLKRRVERSGRVSNTDLEPEEHGERWPAVAAATGAWYACTAWPALRRAHRFGWSRALVLGQPPSCTLERGHVSRSCFFQQSGP